MFFSFWLVDILIYLCSVGVLFYLYSIRNFNYWKKRGIPYAKPVPFFGNMLDILLSRKSFTEVTVDTYKNSNSPYMGMFLLNKPALLVKDPDLLKMILVKDFDNFSDRGFAERKERITCHMLPMLKDPEWKELRKLTTPMFSSAKTKEMYKLVAQTGEEFVEYLSNCTLNDEIIDSRETTRLYSFNVIVGAALGLKGDCFRNKNSEVRKAAHKLMDTTNSWRAFSVFCYVMMPRLVHLLNLNFFDAESISFLSDIFWKTVNYRVQNSISCNDMVQSIMKIRNAGVLIGGSPITDDQLVAQILAFVVGGYETTSNAITFCLYEMAKNPECQKKAREEIRRVFHKRGSEEFTYEILSGELKYTTMSIKETLRKYPALPVADRSCQKDYQIPGTNDVIQKGTAVYIPVYALHMDPDNFSEPEKFMPERFSEENACNIKPFTYFPFGEGPRMCIGERFGMISVASVVARVLYNFELEVCDKTMKKFEICTRSPNFVPKSKTLFLRYKKINRIC